MAQAQTKWMGCKVKGKKDIKDLAAVIYQSFIIIRSICIYLLCTAMDK